FGANLYISKPDKKKFIEHLDGQLSDDFLKQLVETTYAHFKLFHHSFFRLRISSLDNNKFKLALETYFSNYLPIIESSLENAAVCSLGNGITPAPFDQDLNRLVVQTAARLSTLVQVLGNRMMILYKDSLAWSSLESQDDTKLVFDWFTHPEVGLWDDGVINQVKAKGLPAVSSRLADKPKPKAPSSGLAPLLFHKKPKPDLAARSFKGFLVGPEIDLPSQHRSVDTLRPGDAPDPSSPIQVHIKTVYLSEGTPHVFLVYQWDDWSVVMLSPHLDSGLFVKPSWYIYLQDCVLEVLQPLVDSAKEKLHGNLQVDPPASCLMGISINSSDFIVKSSAGPKLAAVISPQVLACLEDIKTQIAAKKAKQCTVLTADQKWVCGLAQGSRTYFLVLEKEGLLFDSSLEQQIALCRAWLAYKK
ncbi:hypothetical protein HDU91_001636, partial [Kappamyces sp. JEL0680]